MGCWENYSDEPVGMPAATAIIIQMVCFRRIIHKRVPLPPSLALPSKYQAFSAVLLQTSPPFSNGTRLEATKPPCSLSTTHRTVSHSRPSKGMGNR